MTHKSKHKKEQPETVNSENSEAEAVDAQVEESAQISEVDALRLEVEAKQKEINELHDKFLRNQAENENFQKRIKKEQVDFMRFATEGLVNALLPVMDDLDRAIESAEQTKDVNALADGVKLISSQLKGVLEKVGVTDVKAEGEVFDPAHHEAVHVVETDEHQEDSVVQELRKGYKLNERILRPAMVAVAKKKSK